MHVILYPSDLYGIMPEFLQNTRHIIMHGRL